MSKRLTKFLLILTLFKISIASTKISCEVNGSRCTFKGITIEKDEDVSIEVSPGAIQSVTSVMFEGCRLYAIPGDIFKVFQNLENLEAIKQDIREITPGSFIKANELKIVELSGNKLTTLHSDTFKGADKLEMLHISSNELSEVSELSFRGLKNLKVLNLGSNAIKTVSRNLLEDQTNLEQFIVSQNKLQFLPDDIFKNSKNLKIISLNINEIHGLLNTMFRELKNLKELDLTTNKCISKKYSKANLEFAIIEADLETCASTYVSDEKIYELHERIDGFSKRVDQLNQQMEVSFKELESLTYYNYKNIQDLSDEIEEIRKLLDENYAKCPEF